MLRKIYLSPFGIFFSWMMRCCAFWRRPFMVYGHYNRKQGRFMKHTRISSMAVLSGRSNTDIGDHVWIGHFCLLDGIGGIKIGEGVHIASHCCLYTHSSQNAIRLLGKKYIEVAAGERPGYILKEIAIGAYSFIGTSSVILPGVRIGTGCIIGAGSVVTKDIPDFSIAAGNPAQVTGSTKELDEKLLGEYKCQDSYYLNKKG